MAEPQRRSTDDESTHDESTADEATEQDDAPASEGTVSETDAPDGQEGLGDAPDVEPQGESDLAQADPRSAQTAGATGKAGAESEPDEPDSSDDDAATAVAGAGTKKQKKSPGAKPAASVKAKKDADETPGTTRSGSTRSGNPARKAAADQQTKKSSGKVSRTPAKPKVIGNRWAAPLMLISAGIGLAWIVVFYVTQDRIDIPWYSDLGSWNLVIGMGFIVAAFGFAMKWE